MRTGPSPCRSSVALEQVRIIRHFDLAAGVMVALFIRRDHAMLRTSCTHHPSQTSKILLGHSSHFHLTQYSPQGPRGSKGGEGTVDAPAQITGPADWHPRCASSGISAFQRGKVPCWAHRRYWTTGAKGRGRISLIAIWIHDHYASLWYCYGLLRW